MDEQRRHQIVGGVWLLGLAALLYTGHFWPGIMFLIGLTAIVEGIGKGRGWYALQGGLWSIAIGIWAIFHFNFAVIMATIGLSMILGAFVRPPFPGGKPVVDNTLE